MILLIDNYDSFSYNLYQLIGEIDPDIRVVRNDELTIDEIRALQPARIVLSPGPGRPEQAGNIIEVVKTLGQEIPILGVCLGHQAICQAFGGTVSYAKELMHGKQSVIQTDRDSILFKGLKRQIPAARYHSLAVSQLPPELKITARTSDGEVMAVEHKKYPVFGVQFHPESVLTPDGEQIIHNFLEVVKR